MTAMPFSLRDRVVLVTGAAQGIGRVIAQRFAEAGAAVALADRQAALAREAADALVRAGSRAAAFGVDVASEASVAAMADAVQATLGPVDVLVNNAALFSTLGRQPFEAIALDEWDAVMRVNVHGPFLCARAVVGGMRAARRGRILNVSSNTVALGRPGFLHYVTSKAAVIGMTRAMARELGGDGITVNAVMPSLTRTGVPMAGVTDATWEALLAAQCVKRSGTPDDVAALMLYLASDAAAFVTGQTIAADGGAVHL